MKRGERPMNGGCSGPDVSPMPEPGCPRHSHHCSQDFSFAEQVNYKFKNVLRTFEMKRFIDKYFKEKEHQRCM